MEPILISNLIERHGSPCLILFPYCSLEGPGDLFFSLSDSKLMSAGAVYVRRNTAVREAREGITIVDSLSVFTDLLTILLFTKGLPLSLLLDLFEFIC